MLCRWSWLEVFQGVGVCEAEFFFVEAAVFDEDLDGETAVGGAVSIGGVAVRKVGPGCRASVVDRAVAGATDEVLMLESKLEFVLGHVAASGHGRSLFGFTNLSAARLVWGIGLSPSGSLEGSGVACVCRVSRVTRGDDIGANRIRLVCRGPCLRGWP